MTAGGKQVHATQSPKELLNVPNRPLSDDERAALDRAPAPQSVPLGAAERDAATKPFRERIEDLKAQLAEARRPRVPAPGSWELAVLSMAFARLAMRAGLKVLAYKLKPDERVGGAGGPWIVTVNLPDDLPQLCFSFDDEQATLLGGVPNAGAYPVDRKELTNESFEGYVRAMLTLVPEALKVAEESPWRGVDGSPASHERIMRSL